MAVAIWNDSVEMVQLLLEFGADPNEQEPIRHGTEGRWGGDPPLHDAVHKGSVKMVKLLLSRGANPDIQNAERLSPFLELLVARLEAADVRLTQLLLDSNVGI